MFSARNLVTSLVRRQSLRSSVFHINSSASSLNLSTQWNHRCDESDPSKHQELHHGLFYTVPDDVATKLFSLGGWDQEQQTMFKTFREQAIMVRKPSLDLLRHLKQTDFTKQPNRYVLYGPVGSGKTFTLNHILHYGYSSRFVLLYCHKPTNWTRFPQEKAISSYNERRIDTPLDATIWLQHFKSMNGQLVDELKLTSQNDYTWSQREFTKKGDALMSIVDHGINRIKHASDCMAVLLKELKLNAACNSDCRLLVVADKVNAFYESSLLRFPDLTYAEPDNITIARAFKQLFKADWQNGAIVASVDKKLVVPYRIFKIMGPTKDKKGMEKLYKHYGPFKVNHLSDLPEDLLTDVGLKDFKPFIPIEVGKYSDKEVSSCLDYYEDRDWLQRPEARTQEGRDEIHFLCGQNPFQVYEFCTNL